VSALRTSGVALLLCTVLAVGGCALAPLGHPVPSMANIAAARSADLPPMALGPFQLAAGKSPVLDQRVSIRSNNLYSPYSSSFSAYLRETLATDLRAAGLLDSASTTIVSGELTDSRIDVPTGTASATVAARFTVTRGGATLYVKELRARTTWASGFVGAEAVPMAVNHYEQLYRQLVASFLGDAELQAAVRR